MKKTVTIEVDADSELLVRAQRAERKVERLERKVQELEAQLAEASGYLDALQKVKFAVENACWMRHE